MVWFKNDDGFYDHPKVVSIPRALRAEAAGTWLLAGTWCARHLTNGVIPAHMIEELAGTTAGANALVKAKLWTKTRTEYRFKSWDDYQPTREAVETARETERTRKAEYRAKARGHQQEPRTRPESVPAGHLGDTTGSPDTPTRPDPTRPLPTEGGRASAATPPVHNPGEDPEPPDRCARHAGIDLPPRCGTCKDARLAHDAWEARQQPAAPAPRPPRWDPVTHCEHGQLHGACDACAYEAAHAAEIIRGRFRVTA